MEITWKKLGDYFEYLEKAIRLHFNSFQRQLLAWYRAPFCSIFGKIYVAVMIYVSVGLIKAKQDIVVNIVLWIHFDLKYLGNTLQ